MKHSVSSNRVLFSGLRFLNFSLTEPRAHGCHILRLKTRQTLMHRNGQGFPGPRFSDYSIDRIPSVRHCTFSTLDWWTDSCLCTTKGTYAITKASFTAASRWFLKLIAAATKHARDTPQEVLKGGIKVFMRTESCTSFYLHFSCWCVKPKGRHSCWAD